MSPRWSSLLAVTTSIFIFWPSNNVYWLVRGTPPYNPTIFRFHFRIQSSQERTELSVFLLRLSWSINGSVALDRTVAPSGPATLGRRKSAAASAATSSQSASHSAPTRIIYREGKAPYGSDLSFWQQNWFIALLFVMAMCFFSLAVFLFLGLDFDQGSPSPSYAATSEGVEVKFQYFLF